ncbi:MAG: hypothetical protein ACI8YQ_002632 [Polaribacter sp.]|jgi:uncharacterized protein YecE (DUF72 family)
MPQSFHHFIYLAKAQFETPIPFQFILMKFGKLPDISSVNFRLPADPQRNSELKSEATSTEFYLGATGWSMKEWIGRLYPKGTKAKDFLSQYTKHFNTIELNTTHYRIPTEEIIEKWFKESSDDFRFCPKIPQTISHSRDLDLNDKYLSIFCKNIVGLKHKLGCCFIQLPPYFDRGSLAILENFLNRFPPDIPLAVELRHESWFEGDNKEWADLLQKYNRTAVITDVAGRRDVLHMELTNSTTMIRFVGNDLHPSDEFRAAEWVERLSRWKEYGLKDAYIFTHEPDNLLSPEMADIFVKRLSDDIGVKIRGPVFRDENEGSQISLF